MKYILVIVFCLFGCTLFRKTNKERALGTQASMNQLESNQLILKKADKETQIFTYWNDSGFYQYQHIKEQSGQTESAVLKTKASASAKQVVDKKKTQPLRIWVYIAVLTGLISCCLIWRNVLKGKLPAGLVFWKKK